MLKYEEFADTTAAVGYWLFLQRGIPAASLCSVSALALLSSCMACPATYSDQVQKVTDHQVCKQAA